MISILSLPWSIGCFHNQNFACPKLCEYPSIFDNCCISLYPTAQSIRDQAVGRVGSVGLEIMLLAAAAMVRRLTIDDVHVDVAWAKRMHGVVC